MTNKNPPQSGAVIHHHDQSITCVSFKTSNAINNNPKKPTPPLALADDLLELELLMYVPIFYIFFIKFII